ncbi:MAG: hypothetical protein PHI63_04165 [Patescibacteria group bacterium]|nr:hypothetical protein [Patescibacteria group bacterium]
MFTSQQKKFIAIGVVAGVVVLVVALRFTIRPASPLPTPVSDIERYFTFPAVDPQVDPIIAERERKNFDTLTAALRQDPEIFDAWLSLGGIKKMMGDFTGAAEIWEYAGMQRPSSSIAFQNLGDLYANYLKDYPKAETAFRRAIKNSAGEEKNALFYMSLFDLYHYRLQDSAKAAAALEEGIAANSWSVQLLVKAARYESELGNRTKALGYYAAAVKLVPTDKLLAEEYRKYRNQQ